ncbi:hypothetical protein PITC_034500 [Penicillium italicum]|uniref:Uncharacterized protein n=1 Tax=Penicillium italicum TaxID=40296 RepID=A0A0A2LE71_PENIT|nr:hypothetical protein PITC_034500 [Penicillium italicum]
MQKAKNESQIEPSGDTVEKNPKRSSREDPWIDK